MKSARVEICGGGNELGLVVAGIALFGYLMYGKPEKSQPASANPISSMHAHYTDVNGDGRPDLVINDCQGYAQTFIRREDGLLAESECGRTLDEFLARQR